MPEAWYPNPPPVDDGPADGGMPLQTPTLPPSPPPVPHVPHELWSRPSESGGKKYLIANNWGKISKADKDKVRRTHIHGVEVRDLPVGHLLHGEQGLFATKRFDVCDIIGEYTGVIVGHNCYGHYVAALDHEADVSLGVDSQDCGNELRFINSYLNVAFSANMTLRVAHVSGIPHVLVVCKAPVEPGDELLLDYGQAYNDAYLLNQKPNEKCVMSQEGVSAAWAELAGGGSSSDEDEG